MAEDLMVATNASKKEKYTSLLPQIEALISGETDTGANQANIIAALWQTFRFFWVGIYWVKDNQLVLSHFQGPIACTRIAKGKGVCGAAWQQAQSLLVPDVDAFPGHIACSSDSKSEVVIPIFKNNEVIGVLDVDSDQLNDFDQDDVNYLEQVAKLLAQNV